MLSFTIGLGVGILAGTLIGIIMMSATAVYRITMLDKHIELLERKIKRLENELLRKTQKRNTRKSKTTKD